MGIYALVAVACCAFCIGGIVQIAEKRTGYDWLFIGLGGTLGAYFASLCPTGIRIFQTVTDWGPQIDGFYLVPGIVGGALGAFLAYLGTRYLEPKLTTA